MSLFHSFFLARRASSSPSIFVVPSRRSSCPSFVSSLALSTSVASGQTLPLPLEAKTKAARAAKELFPKSASSFKKRSFSHRFDDDGDDDSRGTSRGDVQVRFVFFFFSHWRSLRNADRDYIGERLDLLSSVPRHLGFLFFTRLAFVSMLTHLSLSSSPPSPQGQRPQVRRPHRQHRGRQGRGRCRAHEPGPARDGQDGKN